jgi:hypothetical protein
MCRSTFTLFSGLLLRTSSLLFAADAFPKLQGPLLALDLINLRRGNGLIHTEVGGTVLSIPREIWDLSKMELTAIAVEEAEVQLIAGLRCDECRNVEDALVDGEVLKRFKWTASEDPDDKSARAISGTSSWEVTT